jgi:hypothetical protein
MLRVAHGLGRIPQRAGGQDAGVNFLALRASDLVIGTAVAEHARDEATVTSEIVLKDEYPGVVQPDACVVWLGRREDGGEVGGSEFRVSPAQIEAPAPAARGQVRRISDAHAIEMEGGRERLARVESGFRLVEVPGLNPRLGNLTKGRGAGRALSEIAIPDPHAAIPVTCGQPAAVVAPRDGGVGAEVGRPGRGRP